jgi:hypothetical protein
MVYTTPLVGHHRSRKQKICTAAMRERRRWPKSPPNANAVDQTNRRLLSQAKKKHRKEMEKAKKADLSGRKREQRLREKLMESQARTEEADEVAEKLHEGWHKEWGRQKESWIEEREGLKKELARLKARERREPLKIQHAVQRTSKGHDEPNAAQPVIRYVKGKRGVVQDWARDAILRLVNEGVSMSKTWAVTQAGARGLGVTLIGKWSFRTSRRVVREGGIAAGLMIVGYVLTCIG